MKKIIVAIDGPSSSGKSTIAKELARRVGYVYIDTGAMYRAVALCALRHGCFTAASIDEDALRRHLAEATITFAVDAQGRSQTYLDGRNVEHDIRTLQVADAASRVSALGFVRRHLVHLQREMGRHKGVVMDGRDVGTAIFPEAELKLYVTASVQTRARRRRLELQEQGVQVSWREVLSNVVERDRRDRQRQESPLRQAADAVLIDNTHLSHEEQMTMVCRLFEQAVNNKHDDECND